MSNHFNGRKNSIKALQSYGSKAATITSVVDGMKYVGKIKLINNKDEERGFDKVKARYAQKFSSTNLHAFS